MKVLIQLMMIAILSMVAAPVFAGSAVAIYTCQQGDDASEEDVIATANEWLASAKKLKGGENLQVRVLFPVAAVIGDNDFMFVVIAPSFAEWGAFMDVHTGSAEADENKKYADIANCEDSALWESFGG